MAGVTTRRQIVEAADQLFYRQGFEHTSFTDIAQAVSISRGNFYYHFKTKDEILDAVINHRLETTQRMLDEWEAESQTPEECIRRFIQILIMNKAKIKQYGCPVGTLCTELAKLNHGSQAEANKLFELFQAWLRKQFVLLGFDAEADDLAMHVLARSQGIATLAQAFRNEEFIRREVTLMEDWLADCTQGIASAGD